MGRTVIDIIYNIVICYQFYYQIDRPGEYSEYYFFPAVTNSPVAKCILSSILTIGVVLRSGKAVGPVYTGRVIPRHVKDYTMRY